LVLSLSIWFILRVCAYVGVKRKAKKRKKEQEEKMVDASSNYIEIPESPRKPRTSPLMSPKIQLGRVLSRSLGGGDNNDRLSSSSTPISARFDVKFRGHKTWTVTSRVDLGPNIHDEARFRDALTEISWADIEAFAREIGVSVPPGLHLLLPALRGGLIRRWFELVAAERGLNVVLHFLHADDVVRFPPRLNRVFSRAFEDPSDDLILG